MAHSVADMQVFFMGLIHEHDYTFSCKSIDQLSSLWAAVTICKSNIRDGLRLENMSWRLWYREAMIRKRLESETVIALDSPNDTFEHTTTRLVRTRSLPSLPRHAQHIMDSCKLTTSFKPTTHTMDTTTLPRSPKFYIDQEETSDTDSLYCDHYFDDDDNTEFSDDSSDASSLDNSNMVIITANPNNKPVSLLTNLLQKESSSNASSSTQSCGGLRRSHCYGRLDQWFSAALSS